MPKIPKDKQNAHHLAQVWVLKPWWRRVKIEAARRGETASDLVRRAIRREIALMETDPEDPPLASI